MDFKSLCCARDVHQPPTLSFHTQTVWLMYVGFVHLPNGTTSRRVTHKLVCVHTLSLSPGVMWDQHLNRFGTARVYDY